MVSRHEILSGSSNPYAGLALAHEERWMSGGATIGQAGAEDWVSSTALFQDESKGEKVRKVSHPEEPPEKPRVLSSFIHRLHPECIM